jgi:hypothetical protein
MFEEYLDAGRDLAIVFIDMTRSDAGIMGILTRAIR